MPVVLEPVVTALVSSPMEIRFAPVAAMTTLP